MSEIEIRPKHDEEPGEQSGPNLTVIYGLMAAAFLAAVAFALLIVRPFFLRR